MYTPGVGSISGVLHLTARHPYIAVALTTVLLGVSLVKPVPPPPPLPQVMKSPAFAMQKPVYAKVLVPKVKTK
jgi:hypothetical protein